MRCVCNLPCTQRPAYQLSSRMTFSASCPKWLDVQCSHAALGAIQTRSPPLRAHDSCSLLAVTAPDAIPNMRDVTSGPAGSSPRPSQQRDLQLETFRIERGNFDFLL